MAIVCPVRYSQPSACRNTSNCASSLVLPKRCIGTCADDTAPTLAFGIGESFSQALSVGKGPGATALTRIRWRPHSTASDCVIACTAVLAIADGNTYGEPVHIH